jgi:hypothetical protein
MSAAFANAFAAPEGRPVVVSIGIIIIGGRDPARL